jgi:hypothetical protein
MNTSVVKPVLGFTLSSPDTNDLVDTEPSCNTDDPDTTRHSSAVSIRVAFLFIMIFIPPIK